jgi:hypothetical protein
MNTGIRPRILAWLFEKRGLAIAAFFALICPWLQFPLQSAQQKTGTAIKTGPEPGTPLPEFQLTDQKGKRQTFATIRGPKGALLVFHRSADW